MNSFFGELGKQLAQRWMTLLVLPGALLLLTAAVGLRLGHLHAVDTTELIGTVEEWTSRPVALQVTTLAVFLLASTGSSLLANALGIAVQHLWTGAWPTVPAFLSRLNRTLVQRRVTRWKAANDAVLTARRRHPEPRTAADQELIDRLAATRNHISWIEPTRATWMGDRLRGMDQIVFDRYQLDLEFGWSRLWLVMPDSARVELRQAHTQFQTAAMLGGWTMLYLIVGAWWWPSAAIAVVLGLTAWRRGRVTIATYSDLIEATVDLYGKDLAAALTATEPPTRLTAEAGALVTHIVRKGR